MISTRTLLSASAVLSLTAALILAPATARCGAGPEADGERTLAAIGTSFENAVRMPYEARVTALERADSALAVLLDDGLPKERRSAALFLAADIRFALERYEDAAVLYKRAGDKEREKTYRDDADAARILALEAAGRYAEAAKEWKRWFERHSGSPLMPEASLAFAWNALRRGDDADAAARLDEIASRWPWMNTDPRVVLARSLLDLASGDFTGALAALSALEDSPAVVYLRGLCHEGLGETLKAAAKYQETAERWPLSPLRDTAMMAKADIFLRAGAYRSAAEEMAIVVDRAGSEEIRSEAALREAVAVRLDDDVESAVYLLRQVASKYAGTAVAARAQFLLGETLFGAGRYQDAIVEFNRVLADYFEHDLAARAQYRIGRSLDALGRGAEATSAYQAVVTGYPLSPESPAAAYLAGVGLMDLGRPLTAAPYFQLVMDRYARTDSTGMFVFASPDHQELVEASLCLLELCYHRAGDLGQLSGAPHLMLGKMPPSDSPWRAWSIMIDADALASQARYEEAEQMLTGLMADHPSSPSVLPASRLLAWTYARQGRDELAIATEERMLARYASGGDDEHLSSAYFNKANILFNRKEYAEAAAAYDDYLRRFSSAARRPEALYRAGLCYQRLEQNGDAVDRWEALVETDSTSSLAERSLVRAGDLYFRAGHYGDAKRCYTALLERFSSSESAPLAMLRLAQSEYNAGSDEQALQLYSQVIARFPDSRVSEEAARGIEQALYRLGQRDDGTEILARLVEEHGSSPFAADAQFEIAMRAYNAERFDEAAEQFRRVTSQFPGYSAADRAHYLMAESYRKAGDSREAGLACEQFLQFFPQSEFRPMVHFRLGSVRFEEGKYMQAAVDFTGVLDEGAADEIMAASLYNLALCRRMLGQDDEAGQLLERYRREYPSGEGRTAETAYQMGDIHETAGRFAEAVEEYEHSLAAKPRAALTIELRFRIGSCREQLGQDDGAVKAYEAAMAASEKTDPYRLLAVARCAALYEGREDWKRAIAAYKDLIRNSQDEELVLAANERVSQLESLAR